MNVTIQVCADPDEPNVSSVKLLNIQITAACGLIGNDKKTYESLSYFAADN